MVEDSIIILDMPASTMVEEKPDTKQQSGNTIDFQDAEDLSFHRVLSNDGGDMIPFYFNRHQPIGGGDQELWKGDIARHHTPLASLVLGAGSLFSEYRNERDHFEIRLPMAAGKHDPTQGTFARAFLDISIGGDQAGFLVAEFEELMYKPLYGLDLPLEIADKESPKSQEEVQQAINEGQVVHSYTPPIKSNVLADAAEEGFPGCQVVIYRHEDNRRFQYTDRLPNVRMGVRLSHAAATLLDFQLTESPTENHYGVDFIPGIAGNSSQIDLDGINYGWTSTVQISTVPNNQFIWVHSIQVKSGGELATEFSKKRGGGSFAGGGGRSGGSGSSEQEEENKLKIAFSTDL